MTTPYVDLNSVATIGYQDEVPSSWFATARDNLETLARAPGCVIQRTTTQSITSATPTAIAFNAADLRDTDGFHDTVTNNTRVTIPAGLGGWYRCVVQVSWAASATSRRIVRFRVNGAVDGPAVAGAPANSGATAMQCVGSMLLNAGDYVEAVVQQDTGGALNVSVANGSFILEALS